MMSRQIYWAAVIVWALAITTACQPSVGGTPAPVTVGKIVVAAPRTQVDGSEVFGGEGLYEMAVIATDSSGSSDFEVSLANTECTMGPDSSLVIRPSPTVVVHVESAPHTNPLICSTNTKEEFEFTVGEDVVVTGSDPVFTISYSQSTGIIKLVSGFVLVSSRSTGSSTLLGPTQQIVAMSGQPLTQPVPIDLTDYERDILEVFLRDLQVPDPSEVGGGESPVLQQMLLDGRLTLAVDAEAAVEEPVLAFLESTGKLFEVSLGVEIAAEPIERETVLKLVEEGTIAAVLTPEPFPGASLGPLFIDTEGRLWSINVFGDPEFANAYMDITFALWANGAYGEIYRGTFNLEPDYSRLLVSAENSSP